jgi:hypothetical protein
MPNRRNYFINPTFQITLISYTLVILSIVIAVLWGANHYFFMVFMKMGKNASLPEGHVYYQFLQEQRVLMNRIFLAISAIVSTLVAVSGIFLSHKIAGPIHRICSHMKADAQNKRFSKVEFRKNDFFPELAEAYNLRAHSSRITTLRKKHG